MNLSAEPAVEVPPGVVTVTLTVPDPAGAATTICVAESTVTLVTAAVPNVTFVAPAKFVPVIVTWVPPAAAPEVGLIFVAVGAAM